MKSAILLFALLGQFYAQPPSVPATTPYSDFPLHVHLFGVHWNYVRGSYMGYGRGDLLGPPLQGFDYTFECGEPFMHNAQREEFYQARWKKQGEKLEILMQKVGSDKLQKCELKVAFKERPYGATAPAPSAPAALAPTAAPPAAK
jgi:hypothetical protein